MHLLGDLGLETVLSIRTANMHSVQDTKSQLTESDTDDRSADVLARRSPRAAEDGDDTVAYEAEAGGRADSSTGELEDTLSSMSSLAKSHCQLYAGAGNTVWPSQVTQTG